VEQTADPGGIVDTDILVDTLRKVTEAITFLRGAERYLTVTTITRATEVGRKLFPPSEAEPRCSPFAAALRRRLGVL
jgi:hypothetical protein